MRPASRTDELEDFKTRIDLRDYLLSRAYWLDRKLSSTSYAVMRHTNGEKLIITRKANRHWIYANTHDDQDQGTIIDFVQLRDRGTLGDVRKTLRQWTGSGTTFNTHQLEKLPDLVPSQHDSRRVITDWDKAFPLQGLHEYLENERQLPRQILDDPIFAGRIRTDHRQNALFAHHNSNGICGFEIKNHNFTGFSTGGIKSLFCSRLRPDDRELWICETAIDALSAAALYGTARKRFVSTAGQISPAQKAILQSAAQKMPQGSTIILALDNDQAGRSLAGTIAHALREIDLTGKRVVTRFPGSEGEDYNDVLRRSGSCKADFPHLGIK